MAELLIKDESFRIIGVCMEIHKSLGMGLKEINYKDARKMILQKRKYPLKENKKITVKYKDQVLRNHYDADFVFNSIVVEVKSLCASIDVHMAQALSYLAVSGMKLALVITFGERSLNWKRIVL